MYIDIYIYTHNIYIIYIYIYICIYCNMLCGYVCISSWQLGASWLGRPVAAASHPTGGIIRVVGEWQYTLGHW